MSRYIVKGVPFRTKGAVNVEDCTTSEEVIKKAGLDWSVDKCYIYAAMLSNGNVECPIQDSFNEDGVDYAPIDNTYGIYRTDKNIPLGIVKGRYTTVQNIDAFKFFDKAIGKNKAIWQTAGAFGYGQRIFVSAKLPNNIFVKDDVVDNYLVFTTSHDGSTRVKILLTPIRVVCENTLNAAIRNAESYVSFRHTKSVHDNIDIADEILGITKSKINFLNEVYNHMYKSTIKDEEVQSFFGKVVFTDDEYSRIYQTGHNIQQVIMRDFSAINDAEISMKKVNVVAEMNNYYYSGIRQREIINTKWGAYNAVTGYYSNIDNSNGLKRMDSILYGSKAKKIELAGNILINM